MRCQHPNALRWLEQKGHGGNVLSKKKAVAMRGPSTVVTSITGEVGWWVRRVDFRWATTRSAAGRHAPSPRTWWHADDSYRSEVPPTGGAADRASGERTFEPIFELEPGEYITRVEQVVTPLGAELRKQACGCVCCSGLLSRDLAEIRGAGRSDGISAILRTPKLTPPQICEILSEP
jgi:hypothetical protein